MKLRNILGRDSLLRSYLDLKTGGIQYGSYYVNNLLKIGAVTRKGNRVNIQLLPSCNLGNTLTLKKSKNIISYKVIYYGELDNETNLNLIKQSYRSMDKAQTLNFWAVHSNELKQIFGQKEFEQYLLETCFELGRLPYQFEILHKGNIVDNVETLKKLWESDKKEFELLSYK